MRLIGDNGLMNKTAAITALAVSALALASCSSEATNEDSAANDASTQTTTQDSSEGSSDDTAETTQASAEESAGESASQSANAQTSAAAAPASGRFDEAALKTEFEGLGYQCSGDDDCTKTDGAIIYDIDLDNDSVEAQVQGNDNLDQHFETILSDVGTVFGDYDFGGASWDEIETWALEASGEQESRLGNVQLEHDRGEDDGVPTRDLSIELQNR